MNINDILKKKFEDLTENDQRLIVYKLQNRMMSEFNRNDRQGVYSVTQKIMAYNSNKLEKSYECILATLVMSKRIV